MDDSNSLRCVFCSQNFSTNEELDFHLLSHNVARPYFCKECERRYAYKGALETHMAIHVKEQLLDEQILTKIKHHQSH